MLLAVLPMLSLALGAIGMGRPEFRAEVWAAHLGAADRGLQANAITTLPEPYRKALYQRLTAQEKRTAWLRTLDQFETTHATLSASQRSALDAARRFVLSVADFDAPSATDRKNAQQAGNLLRLQFDPASVSYLTRSLGPAESQVTSTEPRAYRLLSAVANLLNANLKARSGTCDCDSNDDCPQYINQSPKGCMEGPGMCNWHWWGCGYWYTSQCGGLCQSGFAREE